MYPTQHPTLPMYIKISITNTNEFENSFELTVALHYTQQKAES